MFPKGTVVIAITGATIGVTGILTFDSCFPDSIVGIAAQKDDTIPEFIYWSLEYVKKVALAEAKQTTQPNINLKNLNKLKIPVPPIAEQHRIVAYLDNLQAKVDEMKRLREDAMKELDALLPSILDKAFKGEL
jgi:type I restriction enzyme S subunit